MLIYKCEECGGLLSFLTEGDKKVCKDSFKELVANTEDAATEKHVPDVKVDGKHVEVTVGSVEHPMEEKHYIQFIILETKKGYQFKALKPGEKPFAQFDVSKDDEPVAAYEYCNLHGLWKKDI